MAASMAVQCGFNGAVCAPVALNRGQSSGGVLGRAGVARRVRVSRLVRATRAEGVTRRDLNPPGTAEEEAAGLAAVHSALGASGAPACDDDTALWFLRDAGQNAEEASRKVEKFLRWRTELGELTDERVAPSADAGAAYLHEKTDIQGRAVVVVEIAKHVCSKRDLTVAKEHAVKVIEDGIKLMESEGDGARSIIAIWYMKGFGGGNADIDLATFCILELFREYYPRRLEMVACVDSPWAFKPVWAILKPIIGEYSSVVSFTKAKETVAMFHPGEAPKCLQ